MSGQTIRALSCINITILDDDIVENLENFTVKLLVDFSGVNVCTCADRIVIEIIDNDKGIGEINYEYQCYNTNFILSNEFEIISSYVKSEAGCQSELHEGNYSLSLLTVTVDIQLYYLSIFYNG